MFRFGGDPDDLFGQMDRMMNQMMGGMMNDPFSMVPFGFRPPMMASPFGGIPNMMNMIQPHQGNMIQASNNPGTFVSSSFVSYSSDGVNPPQVYERTHMNRVGPSGVREERRTLRDSRTGVQQMSIGRHINERGHVMERSKNHYTGDEEENNEYINIEEEEAPQFNQEWNSHMNRASSSRHHPHRIEAPPARREPMLAITSGDSSPSTSASPDSKNSSDNKKLRVKPISMKKEKKQSKKSYR